MEEKHVPEQDSPELSPEEAIPSGEPEAVEVPLIEALTFTGEDALTEDKTQTAEDPAEKAGTEETVVETPMAEVAEETVGEDAAVSEFPSAPQAEPEAPSGISADEPETPIPEEGTENAAQPAQTEEEKPFEESPEESAADKDIAEITEDPLDLSILDDPELEAVLAEDTEEEPAPDAAFQEDSKEFDEILKASAPQQPAEEQPAPANPHQPRKGRPKRKRGEGLLGIPNILATVVWMALIVAIGVTAGRMLWVCAADVLAFGRDDRPVTITVYESDSMDDIIEKLYDNGLIRYRSLFKLYADISDAEEDIDPGIYDLNTRYDYHALVNMMSASSSRTVVEDVLIPEGYTCRQIFSLLEEKRICTAVDLAAYAASGELKDYWFLEGVERGGEYCLEGYLFPDTYDFYKNSTPREVLEKLLDNFEVRFDESMRAQIDTLNETVTGGGYTVREVTIIASMIEKEAAAPAEAANIAGVIYNRLFRWNGNPAYLNIDAAIVYALDGKNELTREDLQIDSPYNTYTNIGLTPTPISNPGLSSLKAALSPASHNYYYYVLNPQTGMHTFSTTYEEHSAYVAAYAEDQ